MTDQEADRDLAKRQRRFRNRPSSASYSRLARTLANERDRSGRETFDELVRLVKQIVEAEVDGHEGESHTRTEPSED